MVKPVLLSKLDPEDYPDYFEPGVPDCEVVEYQKKQNPPYDTETLTHMLVDVGLFMRVYHSIVGSAAETDDLLGWLRNKAITVINPRRFETFIFDGAKFNEMGIVDKRPLLDYEGSLAHIFGEIGLEKVFGTGHAYHEPNVGFVVKPYDRESGRFGAPIPLNEHVKRVEDEFLL